MNDSRMTGNPELDGRLRGLCALWAAILTSQGFTNEQARRLIALKIRRTVVAAGGER